VRGIARLAIGSLVAEHPSPGGDIRRISRISWEESIVVQGFLDYGVEVGVKCSFGTESCGNARRSWKKIERIVEKNRSR
jgi:hypothetical protein